MVAGVLAGAAALAMLTGGGAGNVPAGTYWQRVHAQFAPPSAFIASPAVTYDMERVPAAAGIVVEQSRDASGTRVTARLTGLNPRRVYGMDVHTGTCGSTPGSAGPRYRDAGSPAGPAGRMPLDFTTDAKGGATVTAWRGWNFRPGGAGSVVIHPTRHGEGDRAACFAVPFGPVAGPSVR
ncbi:superoxide dismutase family protein [Streptomyces sp. NBC_01267]|nr:MULTISPECIES: superoxide dismutase family protein [unclassified Streptomyces]MCX4551372.1 superoxide dismutase family protein [Streptomyces sp. NBC_01500]WSC22752.1 superoxide dismutase family protein [Streptomyces sp. NBC_01766]